MLEFTESQKEHIEERLSSEWTVWLSSVQPGNNADLSLYWFVWDGSAVIVLSRPDNRKLQNLWFNSQVMVALEAISMGSDVVLFQGRAEILKEEEVLQSALSAFIAKYEMFLKRIGRDVVEIMTDHPLAVRITPIDFINWPPKRIVDA